MRRAGELGEVRRDVDGGVHEVVRQVPREVLRKGFDGGGDKGDGGGGDKCDDGDDGDDKGDKGCCCDRDGNGKADGFFCCCCSFFFPQQGRGSEGQGHCGSIEGQGRAFALAVV